MLASVSRRPRRSTLYVLGLLFALAASAWAGAPPTQAAGSGPLAGVIGADDGFLVVRTPHVSVLFEGAAFEPYARQVAVRAERELVRVAALFDRAPFPVTLRIDPSVDVFNAFASALPRPHVVLRAVTPAGSVIGWDGDLLARVIRHELTHIVQLTDTRLPSGAAAPPSIGLVGEGTAVLPPAWFLEGVAVWAESQAGDGGRLRDPRTRALLRTLAADDRLPSLADASLITYAAWPGGETRYLLGASFLDFLVQGHGWDTVLDTLKVFQAGGRFRSFASSWEAATGTSLEMEWERWSRALADDAARQTWANRPARLSSRGGETGGAAPAPDGSRLAWRDDDGVWLAALREGVLEDVRQVVSVTGVEAVTWLDDDTLAWSAVARDPGRRSMDLFSYVIDGGRLRRLTHEAHAHLPRADGKGCLLFVRDGVLEGSAVMRWCAEGTEEVWRAPAGSHIVGLAPGADGRVALSLTGLALGGPSTSDAERVAQGVRLYLLTPTGPRPVPAADVLGNVVDPSWLDPETLLVSGDVSGTPQVYAVPLDGSAGAEEVKARGGRSSPVAEPTEDARGCSQRPAAGPKRTAQLSRALGGATEPIATSSGVVALSLSGTGYDLVLVCGAGGRGEQAASGAPHTTATRHPFAPSPWTDAAVAAPALAGHTTAVTSTPPQGASPSAAASFSVVPYSPFGSLLPYGWLPTAGRIGFTPFGAGIELQVPALDDSGRHALDLRVGYDTGLSGPVGGGYASLSYAWNMPNLVPDLGAPPPFSAAVRVGAWPHSVHLEAVTEVAYGVRADALVRLPVGPYAAAFAVRFDLVDAPSLPAWSVEGRADLSLSSLRADRFGALESGRAFALRGRWTASASGPSPGAWGEAAWLPHVGDVPLILGLRAGYRLAPAVPIALPALASVASVGTRVAVPVAWRWEDGLVALERIDIEPTLRAWTGVGGAVGAGADLAIFADTVVDYDGVMRFGVRGGYAGGWWVGLSFGGPY